MSCHQSKLNIWSIASVTLIVSLLSGLANAGTIPKLENSLALDYVSLTDHGRRSIDGIENEGNVTTWIVGGVTDCSRLPPGCLCANDLDLGEQFRGARSVVCACSDNDQVVNLKGSGLRRQLSENDRWSWEVKRCSKVVVLPNFLSAVFDNGKNFKLRLKFSHIRQLVIHEDAFTIEGTEDISVEFNHCDIETIPPKAFPSYLILLKFANCKIGNISSRFIQTLKLNQVWFDNSTILNLQTEAFYKPVIDSFKVTSSRFKLIRPDAIASGIQRINWTDSTFDKIEGNGVSGSIGDIHVERCTLLDIQSQGFSMNMWSSVTLKNNIFDKVSYHGIDLRENGESKRVVLVGNTWNLLQKDFIASGNSERPFVHVENNTFLTNCSCEISFTSLLSLNESKLWFHEELFQSSFCPLAEKERRCYKSENETNSDLISYRELPQLCTPEMFMCITEVNEMHVNPKLPNRLQVLAYFIGALVLFMVVSLLLTLLVYVIRKQKPGKHGGNREVTNEVPHKEIVKSLNHDTYGPVSQKMTKTPSMPTRLAFLEDVEMEDKGVQTLPTELSADIIEGLREKLSKPDSFWDAKETIDHLYDLIHVSEQSVISSPPDVTCNDNCEKTEANAKNISTDSLKPLVTPTKRNTKIVRRSPTHPNSMSTFAQSPTKTVATGPSPSTSSNSHIYSELSAFSRQNRGLTSPTTPPPLPTSAPPALCDYTEPRDFQTHIYAELLSAVANPDAFPSNPVKVNGTQTGYKLPSTTSVIPTSPRRRSTNLNDLNFEPKMSLSSPTHNISNIHDPNIPNSPVKRPLPSIPPKPVSLSKAK